jgi:predicted secreted protein
MDTIELNSTDDGSSVTLHPGQRVLVKLAEVPATGYTWRALPGTHVVSEDFASAPASGVGGGGIRSFTIIAGQKPQDLRFELVRDWMPELPERTFRCLIEPIVDLERGIEDYR